MVLRSLLALTAAAAVCTASPVKLVIDTDAGFDVDDVGALAVANALQDSGEAEIIAVSHTNGFVYGIGAVSTLMSYYGRDDVPLGAYKGVWADDPNAGKGTANKYVTDLTTHWPSPVKNSSQVPTAVDNYRKVLAAQPDHSVHIASIGITTNMRDLVQSKPDAFSPLSGVDLIAQKVSLIVWMDGMYNFGCAQAATDDWLGPDTGCHGSAQIAVMNWPPSVKQIFSGVGSDVHHGSWLQHCAPSMSPVRQAFLDWLGPNNNGRSAWDPIAVTIAVRGADAIFCQEYDQGGHMEVAESGKETWVPYDPPGPAYNQSRIKYAGDDAQSKISFALNELLCKPPGPWSTTKWTKATGENCYGPRDGGAAHGATDLEHPPSSSCGDMSLTDCQHRCLDLPGCTAVTVAPASNGNVSCFRKADVVLGQCDSRTQYTTYVRHEWTAALGFNCYGARDGQPAHGAKDLENPPSSSCGVMDVRSCQAKCAATPGCSGVTIQADKDSGLGDCYRKADIDLAGCDFGTAFDTYLAAEGF